MTPEQYFTQEFAKLKKEWDESESTHWFALYYAVELARLNSIAQPEWVVQEMQNLIIAPSQRERQEAQPFEIYSGLYAPSAVESAYL